LSKLFVISAPSGGGKTTLCTRLLQDFPKLVLSISSTTRKPRGKEIHGKDYYFLSPNEFQKAISENRFSEWAIVHDHYYGTSKEALDRTLQSKQSVLLDIDVQGAESLKQTYPNQCITFFIVPPDLRALETRLRSRGTDNESTIQKRLKNAQEEMKEGNRFDHVIVNDDLERACHELKKLFQIYLQSDTEAR
jgi:guanylate kinase